MANKRELKRTVNEVCEDLLAECLAASLYNGNTNRENANALLGAIIAINDDYIRRVSHPEPGMKAKLYYKDLKENLHKEAIEIIDQICNLVQ